MKKINLFAKANDHKSRLDKFLSLQLEDFSRTYLSSLIDEQHVLVNNLVVDKPSYKLNEGDEIEITIPDMQEYEIKKEDIPLDIVYEDEDLIIINKPQGLVVHPAPGNKEHTLVNAVMNHADNLSGINGVMRPGIVHRIDKDTSGLICIAKNDVAHHFLAAQLKDHTMARKYKALVRGVIKENNGHIDMPIGRDRHNRLKMAVSKENSKPAITNFTVIKRFNNHTLLDISLFTGRTHQIRVHLSHIGYPIEGDTIYGGKSFNTIYDKGQLLVAYQLRLIHPRTKKEMVFEIPLPDYFEKILDSLK